MEKEEKEEVEGRERERKNRYPLLFHGEDLKSEAPSRSGGQGASW